MALSLVATGCGDDSATSKSDGTDVGPTGGSTADASGGTTAGAGGEGGVTPIGGTVGGSGGSPGGSEGGAVGGTGGDTGGAMGGTGGTPAKDGAVGGAATDMGVTVDAAGGAIPDAASVTPADAGAACQPQDPEGVCGPFSKCDEGTCRPELMPEIYRMTTANIVAPATAADALTAAIAVALSTSPPAINFLIEPYGYAEDGYRFNVGNGRPLNPGDPASPYVFNHTLPIQNIYGQWNNDAGVLRFDQEGQGRFTIFAPGQQVENAAMETVTCWVEIGATVQVSVEPRQREDGTRYVHAVADGFMSVDDANGVVFYVGNSPIPLSGFLENEPIVDADLDGLDNEYYFNIEIDAEVAILEDASLAREPEQVPEQDPACDNL